MSSWTLAFSESDKVGGVEKKFVKQRGYATSSRVASQDQDRSCVSTVLGELFHDDTEHRLRDGGHPDVSVEYWALKSAIAVRS
jgi:hypothetical protein